MPVTSAAWRRVIPRASESSQTRSKASPILSASRARMSSRSQNSRPRSWTHSKYETVTPPVLARMRRQRGDVEPTLVVDAAGHVRDRNHPRAAVVQLVGGNRADLAEALDRAALAGQVPAEPAARPLDDHDDTSTGRLRPEDR